MGRSNGFKHLSPNDRTLMSYIANSDIQVQQMLQTIGIDSIEELFSAIPTHLSRPSPSIDDGMSEYDGLKLMESLAAKNTFPFFDNYLGAGAYEHQIPAITDAVISKSEFLTAYTPYQAEISQGMLQAIFEFQSAICALTGLDAANASVYDGASACAEGALMALRMSPERDKIACSDGLHPHYKAVIEQYLESNGFSLVSLDSLDETVAGVLIQSPNFFGVLEDSEEIFKRAKKVGAYCILCANPISYGLFKNAYEVGADIAVGECQPLGIPLLFGGPYAGCMACKKEFVRQLPGRIVGQTVDKNERRGYVLTLQAREQHIRREKATSNICTNQALMMLASFVTMLWYGPQGLHDLALTNYQRAAYLKNGLRQLPGVYIEDKEHFNEFVVRFPKAVSKAFYAASIAPGVELDERTLLVAVTETKSKEQLDRYLQVAKGAI